MMDGQQFGGVYDGGNGLDVLNNLPGNEGFIFTDVASFHKAVTANAGLAAGGTDVAQLTGGAALRLQSIEATLLRTIQEEEHFKLFNSLSSGNATAIVDEWTIKKQIGGFPGSAFNGELDTIAESQGTYERKTGVVKFLMTMRRVTVVQTSQKTLVDTIAEEKVDATRELKTSIEWALFYGDSAVIPLEFDGILAQVLAYNDTDLIKDMRGNGLTFQAKEMIELAAAINGLDRFGKATDLYCSNAVQSSEFDQKLDPAARVGLNGSTASRDVEMGTPVSGIKTSFGVIKNNPDVFIQEGQAPFEARPGKYPALVTAAGLTAATSVAVAAGANANSKFTAQHAGNYYWAVEAVGKQGRSAVTKSAQQAVVSGDRVTVTITNPADASVTGYVLHRSRKNGTNASADLREMIRIPRAAGATTVYLDDNQRIPGTSVVFVLNQTPNMNAINLRRMLPMTMFPLYPSNQAVRMWAQLLFCYLRIAKIQQHGIVLNVLPQSASWLPF